MKKVTEYAGFDFGHLTYKMMNGVPVGIYRNEEFIIAPDENEILRKDDEVLYYAKNRNKRFILDMNDKESYKDIKEEIIVTTNQINSSRILILGYNDKFEIIVDELTYVSNITVADITKDEAKIVNKILSKKVDIDSRIIMENINVDMLIKITEHIDHIIILNRNELDMEQSDTKNMLLYMKLKKIRERNDRHWTIITELNSDENRQLIEDQTNNDFIVSSNITSMMLAQLVEDYRLRPLFIELLSGKGVNIYLKNALVYASEEERIADLRIKLLRKGYILLGYVISNGEEVKYIYNPDRDEKIKFSVWDKLIVISK